MEVLDAVKVGFGRHQYLAYRLTSIKGCILERLSSSGKALFSRSLSPNSESLALPVVSKNRKTLECSIETSASQPCTFNFGYLT